MFELYFSILFLYILNDICKMRDYSDTNGNSVVGKHILNGISAANFTAA